MKNVIKGMSLIFLTALTSVISACDHTKSISVAGTEWSSIVISPSVKYFYNLHFVNDTLCQYTNVRLTHQRDTLQKINFRYQKTEKVITLTPINIENGIDWEVEIYKKDQLKINHTGGIQIDENSKTMSRNQANDKK